MTPLRFSIALCTYNGAKRLPAQLESYVAQTRMPDELIVCDDGSTDETEAVIRDFAARAPFPVAFHRQSVNLGSTRNFEDAIGRCTGDWIFLSDQDDVWLPRKMAAFEDLARRRPEVKLIATDADVVDDELRDKGYSLWSTLNFTPERQAMLEGPGAARLLCWQNFVTGATCAFHASLVPLARPIPPVWFHDAWIALLAAATSHVALIREPLIGYRQHSTQQVGAEPLTLGRQIELARRMNREYFEKQSAFFGAALERLTNVPLRDSGLLEHLRDKVDFAGVRGTMRSRNRFVRAAMALRETLRGRYHRHAQGFKAVAADVLLS